jgi:hypothetical protein
MAKVPVGLKVVFTQIHKNFLFCIFPNAATSSSRKHRFSLHLIMVLMTIKAEELHSPDYDSKTEKKKEKKREFILCCTG